jgi:hypothetical protein
MGLARTVKEMVWKCDLFKTTEYLRYRGEPEYSTLTGGICSLLIIILFAAVFANSVLTTLRKDTLSWSYDLVQNTTDSFSINCNTKT